MRVAFIPSKKKRAMDCACAKCTDAAGAGMRGELERPDEDEYNALVEELKRALAIVETRDHYRAWMTGDEEPGHPFHGNQYTGGLGAKPTETKVTGVKSGVHELLSSGHGFSMEELQKATGAKTIKQISDALAMLKNPKYAGAQGTLKIEKKGNEFFVTKGGEQVAPPAPAEQPKPEVPALAEAKAEKPKGYMGIGSNETALPMEGVSTKPEADKVYAEAMKYGLAETVKNAKSGWDASAVGMYFKKVKAAQMAQWKANTSSAMIHGKVQQLFDADKQLGQDLIDGMDPEKALAEWKTNTAKEKAGTWPPEKVAAKQAALAAAQQAEMEAAGIAKAKMSEEQAKQQAALVAESNKAQPALYQGEGDYVPEGHVHISAADFANGKFKSEIGKLKSVLQDGHTNKQGNKVNIQHALEERLKDSKAFQTVAAMYKKKGGMYGGSLEAHLISTWASTSADTHPVSICNQLAVRDAFGMDADDVAVGAASSHLKADDDSIWAQCGNNLGFPANTPAQLQTLKAALHDFAMAQYQNTQDHLAAKGIDHVYVARGMKTTAGATDAAKLDTLRLQPVSSFSANYDTAHNFSGPNGSVYLVKVPRQQVFSSYVTGFGCTNEHEVCVLAHPSTTAVQMKGLYNSSLTAADNHVKSTLVAQTPELKAEYEAHAAKKAAAKAKKEAKTAHMYKPPPKPKGAKLGGFAKEAYKAAAKNDLPALQQIAEKAKAAYPSHFNAKSAGNTSGTAGYIGHLVNELSAHQNKPSAQVAAENALKEHTNQMFKAAGLKPPDPAGWTPPSMAKAEAATAAAKAPAGAQPAPAGATMPVAPTQAPASVSSHPEYSKALYEQWAHEGKSLHWVGKKLAMMKFQAKQKALAQHVLGA